MKQDFYPHPNIALGRESDKMQFTHLLAAALAVTTSGAFPNIPILSDIVNLGRSIVPNSCDCSGKNPGDPLPKFPLANLEFYEDKLINKTGFVAQCNKGKYENNQNCFFHTRNTYLWGLWVCISSLHPPPEKNIVSWLLIQWLGYASSSLGKWQKEGYNG